MSKLEEVAAACRQAVECAGKLERSVSFEEMSFFVARAAIEAMREPTKAMQVAGGLAFEKAAFEEGKIVFEAAADAFQAMISAALNEEG